MNPSKRKMYAILAGVGISLGAAGIASAASSPTLHTAAVIVAPSATAATTVDTTVAVPVAAPGDANRSSTPPYTSSATIPIAADGTKPTDAQLQAVATVSSDQATAVALANTPGTAGPAALKSVGGNVVWDVDVTATAGGSSDVIIDAGNAKVLDSHVEGGNGGSHDGGRGDATPSYTSSVTIAAAADGSEPTDAQIQAVATVSSDQAIAAALANTPGTAGPAALKSVGGNVVWEVDVTATAGGSSDVTIDAGNATVLDSHVEGHGGGHKGHEGADASTDAPDTASTATTTG